VSHGDRLDDHHASLAFWMRCSILRLDDGSTSVFPHIIKDRAKPGLWAVNAAGQRFVSEAGSYREFVQGMLRDGQQGPAYLICDRGFIRDYGIGLAHPGTHRLSPFIKVRHLIRGDDLQTLARAAGVDAAELEASIWTITASPRPALTTPSAVATTC
jgi:hypothetical protein